MPAPLFRVLCLLGVLHLPSILCAINADSKSLSTNTAFKSDVVEGSGLPGGNASISSDTDWHASGVSPDDEDGDVEEGSGAVEGSGAPPVVSIERPTSTLGTTTSTTTTTERHVDQDVYIGQKEPDTPPPTQWPTTTSSTARPTTTTTRSRPAHESDEDSIVMLRPGILAAVSGGAVVGILMTILLVMFIVYRIRQRDEGSYALDEPHPHYTYSYQKANTKEFYA